MLQAASSHPLKEGHPAHMGNGDGGDKEGEEGKQGEEGGGGGKGDQRAASGSGSGGGGGSGSDAGLREQVAALQRQLERQGELLEQVAARLAPAPPPPSR